MSFSPSQLRHLRPAGWLRVALLVLAAGVIWCAHHGKWTWESWQVPTDYEGDAPEVLAEIQAASEGDTLPFRSKVIERLGAPFGADWNAYPTPDKVLMVALGGSSHLIGLFAAANVGMVLTQVMAALAFYFAARWLRCRWEWAWVGALLFAFTYHTFHRGLAHFSIAISWTVPLGLLAVGLVARSSRLEWRSAEAAVCGVAAVALGMSNPYNLLFWLQLMAWALVAQAWGKRRRANLAIGLAAMGVAVGMFLAMNLEYWVHVQEPEGLPLVTRNYAGTEIYALKPMEMFIPPVFHRWDALAFLGHRYVRWSIWRGEVFFPYLGLVGIAAALWLAVATVRRLFTRRVLPGQSLSIGWLLAYSAVGGLTNVMALVVGIQIFRATNRVAVYISALLLLFLMVRLSRLTGRLPAWGRLAAVLTVGTLGLLDQIPQGAPAADRAQIAARVTSDLQLGREMEAALPPGAQVFQLPVMGFPEEPPPGQLTDYELFRPYLTTQTLRFSYGAAKYRSRSQWQRDLEDLPAATLVERLERYGFAALHVNRKGYEDRAARLLEELTTLGYTRRLEGARGHQVVVLLNPSPTPDRPLGRTLTFGQGWHPQLEDGLRWANDDGVLSYFNPYDQAIEVDLQFSLVATDEREIGLEHEGRRVAAVRVGADPVTLRLPRLALPPGVNRFALVSSQRPVRLGTGRYQLRTFGLRSSAIAVVGGVPPPR